MIATMTQTESDMTSTVIRGTDGDNPEDSLFGIKRNDLKDSTGLSFVEFRRTLKINHALVWIQILGAWAVIGLTALAVWSLSAPIWVTVLAGLAGGLLIGYAIAFLALWFHEAAHFNIHPDRKINDTLANAVIGPAVGLCMSAYRPVHFAHHARLGMTDDPERSYFSPLTLGFLAKTFTGLHVLDVLRNYTKHNSKNDRSASKPPPRNWMFPLSIALHLAVVALGVASGNIALAIAWFVGVFMVYPFLGALRQLLEHRRFDARDMENYTCVPHGAYTRVFPAGPFSSTFGGAGFNRHLLHHWDPGLSCTVFAEVETFILDSKCAAFYEAHRSTYSQAFRKLLRPRTDTASAR